MHRFPVRKFPLIVHLAVLLGACADQGPDRPGPAAAPGVFVTAARQVFVSSVPGSLGDGVTVRVGYGGVETAASVLDGGFDPIALPAVAGDAIRVEVLSEAGIVTAASVVAIPLPPIIVRTDPPKRRTSVPLNTRMTVVFSEPIDPASVTSATIRLTRDGADQAATITLLEGGTIVEVSPAAPLAPNATYSLEITTGIADLDGEHLAEGESVVFETGSGDPWIITPDTVRLQVGDYSFVAVLGSYLPPSAEWSVDDPGVATVTGDTHEAVVRGAAVGETVLRARLDDGSDGGAGATAVVLVSAPGTLGSVVLDPTAATIAVGDTVSFTLKGDSLAIELFGGEDPSWFVSAAARVLGPVLPGSPPAPGGPRAVMRYVALEPGTARVWAQIGPLIAEATVTIQP